MAVPNIVSTSDPFPQSLVAHNIFLKASYPKCIDYERDWPRFDQLQTIWIIVCFHLTQNLKNPRKLSLKSLSLYVTHMHF